ncbi:FtsK/SpoIIIE domain-containing protein [Dactylosporangium vinaceum]
MKLKFTLQRPGAPEADLVATVDATATVGDLARHLLLADPAARGARIAGPDRPTLHLIAGPGPGQGASLDPGMTLAESGLRSGARVAVTRSPETYPAHRGEVRAVVVVTAGPDAGREFALTNPTSVIGRERGCDVRLSDPLASRQHARLILGPAAEIVDLGSANGLEVGGSAVTRAVLSPGDAVRIGDTELIVRLVAAASRADTAAEGFVRSPRLDPRYTGEERTAPEPPQRPAPTRLPFVAMIAPMLMGGALYLITRSIASLAFVALSPLMMLGYSAEGFLSGRSAYRKGLRVFRAELERLDREAAAGAAAETMARNGEHPPLAACVEAVRRSTPLLWTRRPGEPGFGEIRLGTGRRPARDTIAVPTRQQLPRELLAEIDEVVRRYRDLPDVPVVADLTEGAVGLAGPREALFAVGRSLLLQLAALHSPAELVLAAFVPPGAAPAWSWLTWLPHTTSAHSPINQRHLVSTIREGVALVSALEELLERRLATNDAGRPAVVVLVEDDAPVERSRLVELAERGPAAGVHVIWLAPATARLPAACRSYVSLHYDGSGGGVAGFVGPADLVDPLAVEGLDAATAVDLARRLAPLVDVGARIVDDSDLPRSVPLFNVSETPLTPDADVVLERWQASRSIVTGPYAPDRPAKQAGTLRAVIGRTAVGPHAVDLRADGPHALVGGTTGAGKSELLQSWILAMAAAHSPQRLTFLLIDYKGGSAFKDLVGLPHQVGLVTDLDPHEVRRAMVSLSAELRRREKLFAAHQVKDLVELEKKGSPDAPPSLVIVVDEFAALVAELPEFVDGMINVAQRGRSLGVHLILATQRPAGVIKDNLRANTNLRLALRTADEADSVDVLGSPEAAFFDSAVPGRAVSKTGPGRLVPFQTGYAGGWTGDEPEPARIGVEELGFGAPAAWELPELDEAPVRLGEPDIRRLVTALDEARTRARIYRPARPWLAPLATLYDISDPTQVPTARRDDELVFGVCDVPTEQRQPTVAFYPDLHGNLAVYGTGGSGKSTLLRTIAVAAGSTVRGGPCQVYGLDFAGRALAMLEALPHVGSIIGATDHERVARLITGLGQLIAERALRFSAARAGSITEYRTAAGGVPDEPRILLLVDGVAAFRQAYETGERAKFFDAFCAIAVEGRPVGVHVFITADRPASVPSALASAMQTRVALRMADVNEYQTMNLPHDVLKPSSPPGRGMIDGVELQVAILGGRADMGSQAAYCKSFGESMVRAGMPAAPPIASLSKRIDVLPADPGGAAVLGVAAATLGPATFVPEGVFLVAGPPQSGRTTAMRTIAAAVRHRDPAVRAHLFTPQRRSPLAAAPVFAGVAAGAEAMARHAKDLADRVRAGERVAVFIEKVPTGVALAMASVIKASSTADLRRKTRSQRFPIGG